MVFLSELHNLGLTRRKKTPAKCKLKDILQNTSPVLLKTIKIIESKKNLRNCHNREETEI